MTKTYIVAAKRTAIGKFLGTTLSMTAADLGAAVIKNIIAETVKISENRNGIAVRLYECERTRTDCNLYLNGNYEIYECDMTEENKRLIATGDVACLSFRQFEIKTLFLKKI